MYFLIGVANFLFFNADGDGFVKFLFAFTHSFHILGLEIKMTKICWMSSLVFSYNENKDIWTFSVYWLDQLIELG